MRSFGRLIIWVAASFLMIAAILVVLVYYLELNTVVKDTKIASPDEGIKDPTIYQDLVIYHPIDQQTVNNEQLQISGYAKAAAVLMIVNQHPQIVYPDDKGEFKVSLALKSSINQLSFLIVNSSREIVGKRVVVGYDPSLAASGSATTVVGEIQAIHQENNFLDTTTRESTKSFQLPSDASIEDRYNHQILKFGGLRPSDQFGAILNSEQPSRATTFIIDRYPYYFTAQLKSKESDHLTVQPLDSPTATAELALHPETQIFRWNGRDELMPANKQNIGDKQALFVVGTIVPRENRTHYSTNLLFVINSD